MFFHNNHHKDASVLISFIYSIGLQMINIMIIQDLELTKNEATNAKTTDKASTAAIYSFLVRST